MWNKKLKAAGCAALALAVGSVVAETATEQDLPDARSLIERHIEALGGREAILAHSEGTAKGEFSMPAVGITGTLMVASRPPAEQVVHIELPGMGEMQTGFSPELAWSVDPFMGPRLIEGEEFDSLLESTVPAAVMRDPEYVLSATTVEQAEFLDQACYRVRLEWRSGRETHDCYALETGLLIATQSLEKSPMGEMEALTLLDEYREMEGFLVPTVTRLYVMGQEQVMTLTEFSLDAPDPALFERPPPIQTLLEDR